jgi:hypothetical protein
VFEIFDFESKNLVKIQKPFLQAFLFNSSFWPNSSL